MPEAGSRLKYDFHQFLIANASRRPVFFSSCPDVRRNAQVFFTNNFPAAVPYGRISGLVRNFGVSKFRALEFVSLSATKWGRGLGRGGAQGSGGEASGFCLGESV